MKLIKKEKKERFCSFKLKKKVFFKIRKEKHFPSVTFYLIQIYLFLLTFYIFIKYKKVRKIIYNKNFSWK
jgi:hypothetical protein